MSAAAKRAGFAVCDRKGFHITFVNGITASVQFGRGNYCENRDATGDWDAAVPHSGSAEIAAFRGDEWFRPADWNDDVAGWKSPAEVLDFLNWVAAWPPVVSA